MSGLLEDVARLNKGRSKRISSYDRTGGNRDCIRIDAGETVDIANISGAGVIKHIWFTLSRSLPMAYRNVLLRIYWDGEKRPSVASPIGDFFGQGWGEVYPYEALPICGSPNASGNCYLPMPFANGARIEIENDGAEPCTSFYYYVDYEERNALDDDMGRFHAYWRRRVNVPSQGYEDQGGLTGASPANLTDKRNHVFIDAEGAGQYVGINYYVDCPTPIWYGEGDDMFFIDGEPWPPSLHGTGTEDYFCTSWNSPHTPYCHPYFGYPRLNESIGYLGRTHCYRFHVEDPIIFQKSLRGSIECGHANALPLDIATVAYWYQTEPHKPFPALPGRAGRQNMPAIGRNEIHLWRQAWLKMMGGGGLWGHEKAPAGFVREMKKASPGLGKQTAQRDIRAARRDLKAQEQMLNRRKKGKKRK